MSKKSEPRYKNFDAKQYVWKADINYRTNPENYRVGKGEQGVLICEPYKSELVKHWRFKTPEIAQESSDTIFSLFLDYVSESDFVGADMARKFLQMGFTRARRYTNYKGGRKYKSDSNETFEKGSGDPQKAISADIFYKKWQEAEANAIYKAMKAEWKKLYG